MNINGSKHLTFGERIAIAELLMQNKSLNEIAIVITFQDFYLFYISIYFLYPHSG